MAGLPVKRGRPRDPEIDARILKATQTLLAERGFEATTVDAVALACRVSRATVYRRFRNRLALIETAVEALLAESVPHLRPTADPAQDLRRLVEDTAELLTGTRFGPVFRQLIPHLVEHPRMARLAQTMGGRRRAALRDAVQRAQAADAIAADLNVDHAIDGLVGALYFRYLVTGLALDRAYLDGVLNVFLRASRAP